MLETEVAVIGGGIQGAGIAQAAAAAGYKTMLFEKSDWACETSSKSSKLIHGGLRYLKTGQFHLVRENLEERELLLRNAPDLVKPMPFYIPIYRYSVNRAWQIRLGLMLYRFLARHSKTSEFFSINANAWHRLDALRTEDLHDVFQYWDAQTDDRKLTRAVVKSAIDLGTKAYCPAEFIQGERQPDGFRLQLRIKGELYECRARTVVNATGAAVNRVQKKLDRQLPELPVEFVRGAHIIVPGTLDKGCYYLESPIDSRPLFAIPWKGNIMIGTTETTHTGPLSNVQASPEEIDYLLCSYKHYFPQNDDTVIDHFAGLRVLPRSNKSNNSRSRDVIFHTDKDEKPRCVAVCGGKLTSFRHTGEQVMALLKPTLGAREPICDTHTLRLRPA